MDANALRRTAEARKLASYAAADAQYAADLSAIGRVESMQADTPKPKRGRRPGSPPVLKIARTHLGNNGTASVCSLIDSSEVRLTKRQARAALDHLRKLGQVKVIGRAPDRDSVVRNVYLRLPPPQVPSENGKASESELVPA